MWLFMQEKCGGYEITQALYISCGKSVTEKTWPPRKCADIGWLRVELRHHIIAFFWSDWHLELWRRVSRHFLHLVLCLVWWTFTPTFWVHGMGRALTPTQNKAVVRLKWTKHSDSSFSHQERNVQALHSWDWMFVLSDGSWNKRWMEKVMTVSPSAC